MATFTTTTDRFPAGTTVTVYPESNWPTAGLPPSGAPIGSSTTSAAVGTDSTLTFTGLTDDTTYYMTASISGTYRYVRFTTNRPVTPVRVTGTPAEGQGLVYDATAEAWEPGIADHNAVSSGQETCSRFVRDSPTLSNQVLRLSYFTAVKSETVQSVRVTTSATAAAATPTLIRFGIYSVASNGDLTLVASTANDTSLLAAQYTAYTKALSSAYAVTAGTRYAFAALVVTGATAPTVAGALLTGSAASEAGIAPRLAGVVAAQTNLPSSVASASVVDNSNFVRGVLVP